MGFKTKNLIIFLSVALLVILVYVFFLRKSPQEESLLISSGNEVGTAESESLIGRDFLTLLLSVKNITLDDSVLTDPAFATLSDSSILLIPDGNEGRPNPFAPLGSDI